MTISNHQTSLDSSLPVLMDITGEKYYHNGLAKISIALSKDLEDYECRVRISEQRNSIKTKIRIVTHNCKIHPSFALSGIDLLMHGFMKNLSNSRLMDIMASPPFYKNRKRSYDT